MALRTTFQVREPRQQAGKSYYQKPVIKPRAPLGSLSANIVQDKDGKKSAPVKPSITLKKEVTAVCVPGPTTKKSPEVEEMEVVTAQLSQKLHIEDIDTIDSDNPQLCAEYVKEIYEYMMMLEKKYQVPPTYLSKQPNINSRMRAILIDWLIQVHQRFTLLQETLYLTISIVDRYLAAEKVEKSKLQLVGVTAMLIASKYEEMYAPEVRDFVFITDDTYSSDDIRLMERHMLLVLDYSLGNPLCLHFLRRYSRAGEATPEVHTMGKFLMELCLPHYHMLEFTPSVLAASALYISKLACHGEEWTPTLEHYTTYSKDDILPSASKMAALIQNMSTAKQQAVRNKYASSKFLKVSKHRDLFGQPILNLASKVILQ